MGLLSIIFSDNSFEKDVVLYTFIIKNFNNNIKKSCYYKITNFCLYFVIFIQILYKVNMLKIKFYGNFILILLYIYFSNILFGQFFKLH